MAKDSLVAFKCDDLKIIMKSLGLAEAKSLFGIAFI